MNVLIIGAGAAGNVVAKKCAMNRDIFKSIHLASRTLSKCEKIQKECKKYFKKDIEIYKLDADNVPETVALIKKIKPDLVINMALPYQDLAIMDACLETKVNYMDTANYEPIDEAKFEYHWQWAYQDKFKKAGIVAILGCGFDPGQTNIYCAYAQKNIFDEIHEIDIIDCNAGNHGQAFATNFNPEINLREVTQKGKYWENGKWIETGPLEFRKMIDYPEVGEKASYLLYHEELESLVQNIKGLKRIRFWMTFGDEYIKHMEVLQNVGMTRIDPVIHNGVEIVPIQFLKTLLPEPSSLAENYTGKTSIGCIMTGIKNGKEKTVLIYNVCDHAQTHKEVQAQAVSYTTGVPPVTGAIMLAKGFWGKEPGVWNVEQLDPDPFMAEVAKQGLPWHVKELKAGLGELTERRKDKKAA
ncbi:MAG: saccharopine dehydrogenase family protein [Alphaproteobacteria bacterium]|nr:saccharopine dehydrogenase family protein [Alphaproteobacteria bacterium]MBP7758207.1 saccharopine dehydrogenase family protein [Alphaproteobacteria bacterium]MBP7761650.1 saccharopine dehydrogenase family protein [Alphaproteobacteria bacterium]MBP7903998.1 saccharopine dehydrogenase family protein [Alphaproteobacteria bacterium]